ncbi:MAG TPA: L-threonylcarbamoyladenylate synthase [Candidatus Acidoferrum sp.]|nr:L-threonylcarbamoyladenylate synthase [Candidatus Acidoferrum sp.]
MSEIRRERIDADHPSDILINQAAKVLESGGLIVIPTETRYGLVTNAENEVALNRLFGVKGRRTDMPTALFVRDVVAMGRLGEMNKTARALASAFMPGPLTLVVKSRVNWEPPRVVGGKIGFRLSSCPTVFRIVEKVSCPLTATSANRSGGKELETVDQIVKELGSEVDLYLDAGVLKGVVSTVVDCSAGQPVILRPGAIEAEAIAKIARDSGM